MIHTNRCATKLLRFYRPAGANNDQYLNGKWMSLIAENWKAMRRVFLGKK